VGLDCEMCATRDDDRELLGLCLIDADGEVLVQVRGAVDSLVLKPRSLTHAWVLGRAGRCGRAYEGLQSRDRASLERQWGISIASAGACADAHSRMIPHAASTANVLCKAHKGTFSTCGLSERMAIISVTFDAAGSGAARRRGHGPAH